MSRKIYLSKFYISLLISFFVISIITLSAKDNKSDKDVNVDLLREVMKSLDKDDDFQAMDKELKSNQQKTKSVAAEQNEKNYYEAHCHGPADVHGQRDPAHRSRARRLFPPSASCDPNRPDGRAAARIGPV